jgi:hypothetical protein
MPDGLFSSWGKPVPGLFKVGGTKVGLYPATIGAVRTAGAKSPWFYKFLQGLLHGLETLFIPVKNMFLHIVHTPYNKRLVYLNLVINSRRLA